MTVVASLLLGTAMVAAFLEWERRAPDPMLPLHFFRSRGFTASNGVSFAMFFGALGSIFLLSQFFQTAQATRPSRPACGRRRGAGCRCSSRRSPGR